MNMAQLEAKTLEELRGLAREREISGYSKLKKDDLILKLLKTNAEAQGFIFGGGVLEIIQDGIGFLRSVDLLPGPDDIYVSQSQIRRFGLRTGDMVIGQVRPPKDTEKYFGLLRVEAVNGLDPETAKQRPSGEAGTLQGVLSTKNGKVHQMTAPTDLEGAAAFRQWVVDCMRGNTGTDLGVDTASLKGKLKQGKDGASAVIALKISYSGTTYGGPNSGGRNRGSFKLKATLPESTPD